MRLVLIAAAVGAALCGWVSTASAALPWLPATEFEGTGPFYPTTALSVAPNGAAALIVQRYDGTNTIASVALRPPGGEFGPLQAVSGLGVNANNAQVGIDADGNTTAMWSESTTIRTSYRPAGGTWSPSQALSIASVAGPSPTLAVGRNGGAVIAYDAGPDSQERVAVAVRLPNAATAAFGPAAFVSPAAGGPATNQLYLGPRVAIDAAGDVAVLWQRRYDLGSSLTRLVVEVATRPAAGLPVTVASLTPTFTGNANLNQPDLAMSPAGRAVAVWGYNPEGTAPNNVSQIEFSERIPGAGFTGTWSPRTRISTAGVAASSPRIALDDQGIVATWSADGAVQSSVRANTNVAFSSPPKALSGTGASPTSARIAAAPDGSAVISWVATPGGVSAFFSARRRPGGEAFGDVTEVLRGVTPATSTPATPSVSFLTAAELGSDDQGNATLQLVRQTYDGSTFQYGVLATVFDAVAPVFGSVSVPGTAVAGAVTAGFSAEATDRLAVPTISWDFGDGATATGNSVTHTYATAGIFTVKTVASDAAGNRTESTRAVQVNTPPAPTPPPASPVASPGAIDGDGDGVFAPQDCNDGDAKIKPGAVEVRGNAVDENCDGRAEPFEAVGASASLTSQRLRNGRTRITGLQVKQLQVGDVVSLTCSAASRGCKRPATRTTTVKRGTSVSFTSAVKGLTLSDKATLVVKVARTGAASRIITLTIVKAKAPTKRTRCQDPGVKTTRSC